VRLRRIFNAKSLEDILGRSSSSSNSRKSSSVSPEQFASSTASATGTNSQCGATSSDLSGGESSLLLRNRNKNASLTSLKIFSTTTGNTNNPGSSTTSSNANNISGVNISSSSIGSGSESGGGIPYHKSKRKSSSSSTLASVLHRIPQLHSSGKDRDKDGGKSCKKTRKKGGHSGEKPSKSLSSGSLNRVSCAKSDNYLNRIVVSATCAKFNVGKSVDNLNTSNLISTETHKPQSSSIIPKKKGASASGRNGQSSSSSTFVEPYNSNYYSSTEVSGSSGGGGDNSSTQSQPQQRRWTAVKHKWDAKLQEKQLHHSQSESTGVTSADETANANAQNLIFIKSQLSQISGIPIAIPNTTSSESNLREEQALQLESCGTSARSSLQFLETTFPSTVKPHEAGRVKFCLEPQEIPASPSISRSQSSDCKPTQIDPSLDLDSNNHPVTDEESEDMTKSRHFHYSSSGGASGGTAGPSRSRRKVQPLHQEQGTSSSSGAPIKVLTAKTSKEKAQLVVANVSYLQRPTSPCLLISPGDPRQSSSSSSPIVFNNNTPIMSPSHVTNNPLNQSITSPLQSPLSAYQQARMMKHEYLNSGSVGGGMGSNTGAMRTNNNNANLNETTNINKTFTPVGGGYFSSAFVPSCVNLRDVISPPPIKRQSGNNSSSSNPNELLACGGSDGAKGTNKMIIKSPKYGGDRVGQESDLSHDDTVFYTNRYKDGNVGNKNVTSAPNQASSHVRTTEEAVTGDYCGLVAIAFVTILYLFYSLIKHFRPVYCKKMTD
jgi:hypothetical protein